MKAGVSRLGLPPLLLLLLLGAPAEAQWQVIASGLDSNLRGLSVARSRGEKGSPTRAVWASGSHGVILQSLDRGESWRRLGVPGGEELDFRGIVAFGASLVYVISSGEGSKSAIYKTA